MGWSDIDEKHAVAGLEQAFALGANLFDTADIYGHGRSERLLGRLVAQVPRDAVVLVSKVGYFAGTAPHGFDPGHMRRQLAQSLDNLGTDHLDVYTFHHSDFGADDRYLGPAVETMLGFKTAGLIHAIGMRGPHRFAAERLDAAPTLRGDKVARFRALFDAIKPDVLAVRDNLLTPNVRSAGIFALADAHDCGVLVNKPLGQGLLTGSYNNRAPRVFGPGDHRSRKRWFGPNGIAVIAPAIQRLQELVGPEPENLIRIALWACLTQSPHAAVLTGFSSADQIAMNVTCLGDPPAEAEIAAARSIMAAAQTHLDADGDVFIDEVSSVAGRPE